MAKAIEIAKAGNIFYLIHFDSFVESRKYFFETNPLDSLRRTKEWGFVEGIRRYVQLATENGVLVNISSVGDECSPTLRRRLRLDKAYFPKEGTSKGVFGFFDDFYREEDTKGAFDERMQEFARLYEEKTGKGFSEARHIFGGCESHDCVASAMQALCRGEGYSCPMAGEQMRIEYNGKRVPIGNIFGARDYLWPRTGRIQLMSDFSSDKREEASVACGGLEDILSVKY